MPGMTNEQVLGYGEILSEGSVVIVVSVAVSSQTAYR